LRTEYKQLEDPALYNLNLKGKNFRSAIMFMLARSIYNSSNLKGESEVQGVKFEDTKFYDQVKALSACIEIAHNASLLQDDIIDRADQRRSKLAAHKVYGASNSVFSSDFMISRASRMLTEMFDTTHISQIFSTILYNLVFVRT
jgi:geranylgeranyl pyrophosphate synthase